jgi:hypothetical protein
MAHSPEGIARTTAARVAAMAQAKAIREAKEEIERWQITHAEACFKSFAYFVQSFWHVIEPDTPLIWGWWLDEICAGVQKQQEGDPEYRWLLVIQPPGTAKSRVMSVLKPAWIWLRKPTRRMLYVGTADEVVTRDSKYTRDVLKSAGWEDLHDPDRRRGGFRDVVEILHNLGQRRPKGDGLHRYPLWTFEKDQDEKGNFSNTRKGVRLCKPIGGDVTGLRGDDVTVDDPVSYKDIENAPPAVIAAHMAQANRQARYIYTTRVNDRELSTRSMVAQRFDPDDPIGIALRDGRWKVIYVTMEFDPSDPLNMAADPRKVAGEVLTGWYTDPETNAVVIKPLQTEETKRQAIEDLGFDQYQAQYNQKPKRASGEFVTSAEMEALETYTENPMDIARRADEVMIVADFTFDDTAGSDKTVIQCWAREGKARFTLLDRVGRQMNYPTMKAEFRAMKSRWPMARRFRIERAAAGAMIRAELESEFPGLYAIPPGWKSKFERARAALQPLIKGRNVVLPDESIAPWVGEVRSSWLHMKHKGKDDDDVDAAAIMGSEWGLGGGDPSWLGDEIRKRATAPRGTEPGLLGGTWQTWVQPMQSARYVAAVAGHTAVVFDAAGALCAVVAEPEAASGTKMASAVQSLLARYAVTDVAVCAEERTGPMWATLIAAQLRIYGSLPRVVGWTVDGEAMESLGVALLAGRCTVQDGPALEDFAAATKGDRGIEPGGGRWSERTVAITGAWAHGVRCGVFAKPGAPQRKIPAPSATEIRLRNRAAATAGWFVQGG